MATDVRQCQNCKKEFSVPFKSIKKTYCSHKCANEATGPKRRNRQLFKCATCGDSFEVVSGSVKVRERVSKIQYCSKECMGIGMRKREAVNCVNCGKEFETTRNSFCSRDCVNEYKKKQNGAGGHWYENGYKVLWNGGHPVKEHVQIMQKHIGRKLMGNEVVHHINKIRDDNRTENLDLMTHGEHSSLHRNEEVASGATLFGRH